MACSVPGSLDNFSRQRAHPHLVTLAHGGINEGDAGGFRGRRYNAAAMVLLQRRDASCVVGMMVGDENVGEPPSPLGERGLHCSSLGSIDCRRSARFGIVQEYAIIVLQAGKEMDLSRHGRLSRPVDATRSIGFRGHWCKH